MCYFERVLDTLLVEKALSKLSYIRPFLNHCSLETPKRVLANRADPDQTPQNAASDQGLHCLQIVQK